MVLSRLKAKCRFHALAAGRPFAIAGLNFHSRAASIVILEKYLLGPGFWKLA